MEDDRSQLGSRSRRVSLTLAGLVTGLYFTFVVAMALRPGWFTARVEATEVEAPALVGVLLFLLLILAVMGGFSWWRGTR